MRAREKQVFEDFLGSRKEPNWLKEYRRKGFGEFSAGKQGNLWNSNSKKFWELLSLPDEKEFVKISYPKEAPKRGLVAMEINEALKAYPEIVKKYLLKERTPKDKFEAHSGAFFTTGYFVFAPMGISGRAEIEIRPKAGLNCAKNVIALENENEVSVSENIGSGGKEGAVLAMGSSAFVEKASKLEFSSLNEMNDKSTLVSARQAVVGKDSSSRALHAWLGSRETKSSVRNYLSGQGAQVIHTEAIFGNGKQNFELASEMMHEVPGTTARIFVREAFNGQSSGSFRGMIKIPRGSQKTDSFMEAHSILLGEGACSNNVPCLEIEANDVKASHAVSVRRIEEEEVFYLESRGIGETEAKRILVSSFFGSVLKDFGNEGIGQRFLECTEQKYGK